MGIIRLMLPLKHDANSQLYTVGAEQMLVSFPIFQAEDRKPPVSGISPILGRKSHGQSGSRN